jgi:hypothetical protein
MKSSSSVSSHFESNYCCYTKPELSPPLTGLASTMSTQELCSDAISSDKYYRNFFLFVSLLSWSSGVVVRSNGMHRSSNAHGTLVFFSYFFSNKWVGWKASVSKTKEILFSWLCFLGVWVPTLHLKYIVLKNRAGRYIGLQTLFFFFLLEILLLFFLPEILFVLSPISLSFSF